jgi:hypothetical protein
VTTNASFIVGLQDLGRPSAPDNNPDGGSPTNDNLGGLNNLPDTTDGNSRHSNTLSMTKRAAGLWPLAIKSLHLEVDIGRCSRAKIRVIAPQAGRLIYE